MPTQDDVLGYFDTLSNWGRWGDDDELGTLNHITDDVRLAASRAVRHGRSVSCAWEIAVPGEMERSTTSCPCAADMPGAENMPARVPRRPALGLLVRAGSASCSTATPSPTSTRRATSSGTARCTTGGRTRWSTPRRDRRGRPSRRRRTGSSRVVSCWTSRGSAMCRGWNRGRACFPTTSRRPSAARVCGCGPAMRCCCGPATAASGTRPVRRTASRRPAGTRPACRGCTNGRSR